MANEQQNGRSGTRRRGAELEAAIRGAALEQLREVGYQVMTMEAVAARARTGKAVLYRRWSGKAELVVDAATNLLPVVEAPADTGSVRTDALTLLRGGAHALSGLPGQLLRGIISEGLNDPEFASMARERIAGAIESAMLEIMRRGVQRGEVRPDAVTTLVAVVPVALLRDRFLIYGSPIPPQFPEQVLDEVWLPLIRP